MALSSFIQSAFQSMNRQVDPSNLNFSGGEYALGVNIRIRNGGAQPIGQPLDITNQLPPITNLQSIYGFDNFLVVFGDGKAFIKDFDTTLGFQQTPSFQMSNTAPIIYAIEVPASTINYVRIPTTNVDGSVIASGPITLTVAYEGAPSAIICQDGQNQPWLILPDGSARVSQTYNQWSQTGNREYIPVGTLMTFVNNKTYVMIQDQYGKYTLMAQSVSGRPCDFVVPIDNNGNASGDAYSTAYSVSYTPLTCLSAVGGSQAQSGGQGVSFYAGSPNFSYLIIPNYTNTIFGEPTYSNSPLFSTGPINNFSIADLLGDTALVDATSIRSFNAILQTRFEGRNAPFSAKIQPFFGDIDDTNSAIIQTVTAATQWSDYGLFAVQTIYGPAVLVYDTIYSSWVSIDIFTNVQGNIKQWADIKTDSGIRELFFITDQNRIYQYLAGPTAEAGVYIGDATPIGNGTDLKPVQTVPVLSRVQESGRINIDVYVDSQKVGNTIYKDIEADPTITTNSLSTYPLPLPFGINSADQVRCPSFDLSRIQQGWKIGYWITWNFKSMLLLNQAANDVKLIPSGLKQQARDYAETAKILAPIQNDATTTS